jgi:hypothetical protein
MTRRVWTGGLTVADGILLAGLAGASPHSEEASTALDVAKSVRREGLVTPGGYVYHTPPRRLQGDQRSLGRE